MKRVPFLLLSSALVLACSDTVTQPEPMNSLAEMQTLYAPQRALRTTVVFSMAVTEFGDVFVKDLGRSGRGMIRDYHLTFEVTGDLEGTARMLLNSNWDAELWWATGPGRGSTWGVVSIMTGDETWEGNLTGEFALFPDISDWNPQLFSKINLHGSDGKKLKAVCDETSPESEVIACTGEILSPKG